MFRKNREKIKALEKEVADLKAENEKIHRILKHVGKEPCMDVRIKTIYPKDTEVQYSFYDNSCWIDREVIYILYFYRDGKEYSVEIKDFKDPKYGFKSHELRKVDWPIVNVILNFNVHQCNPLFFPSYWNTNERYLIQFNCITGKYRRTCISDDLVKVIKDNICEECNKDEKGEEKDD